MKVTIMKRRKFLKIVGTTGIIMAAGGVGTAILRGPADALKPWENAGKDYSDPMRRALSYAILAPNPHNRQPWVVDLISSTEATLYCDLDRLLPHTDPFSRQIVIGLGCFLELFSIAAARQGFQAKIVYFPAGEPGPELDQRPIARLSLVKQNGLSRAPLFDHILKRHTNREPYETSQTINSDALKPLHDLSNATARIGTSNSGNLLQELRILTRDALLDEVRTEDAYRESIDLMRIGRSEINANPDGISLGGPFLESLALVGILTRESLADPKSDSYQIGLDMINESAMTSMGFVWIANSGDNRTAEIEAGRSYMKVSLQVAASGLSMQPMSQSLQEYPEMASYYQAVHTKLAKHPGERIQMLARLGYAKDTGPSPRWSLDTRIKPG